MNMTLSGRVVRRETPASFPGHDVAIHPEGLRKPYRADFKLGAENEASRQSEERAVWLKHRRAP